MNNKTIAVVTGGSSGIGLHTAKALCASGIKTYELSRREYVHTDGVLHISADVTVESQVQDAVQHIIEREGKIDILICNAGFGISGAAEFTDNSNAKRLLDVNLFGVVNSVKAIIPIMRQQGSGRIVCISSVAAPIAIPFQAWYSVSKAAVSAYASALREEVKPFGIQVCSILPGDIRTCFTDMREKYHIGDDIYQGRIAKSVSVMEKDERNGMDPAKAGMFIASVALRRSVKPEYVIGTFYRFAIMAQRLLPGSCVRFLVGKIYAS